MPGTPTVPPVIKHNRPHKTSKTVYYVEEGIVFLITIVAIVFSDLIERYARGGPLRHWEFVFSWYKIIAASFVAILVHGTLNGSFKYSDKGKPPFFKRAYQAVLNGVAWKSLIGLTGLN